MVDFSPAPERFLSAVSLLMAWRLVGSFRATALHRLGFDDERVYTLTADPMNLTYAALDNATETVEQYDGYAHTKTYDGVEEECPVYQIVSEAPVARLAFPLSLPVWGRSFDNYRFTGSLFEAGKDINLELCGTADPTLRGTLTISVPLRMAIRLDVPEQTLVYRDIQWT